MLSVDVNDLDCDSMLSRLRQLTHTIRTPAHTRLLSRSESRLAFIIRPLVTLTKLTLSLRISFYLTTLEKKFIKSNKKLTKLNYY